MGVWDPDRNSCTRILTRLKLKLLVSQVTQWKNFTNEGLIITRPPPLQEFFSGSNLMYELFCF